MFDVVCNKRKKGVKDLVLNKDMPVDFDLKVYQREQYLKGGIGRAYWDYRDRITLSYLDKNDKTIVDVGCGEGITLGRMKERYPASKVFGIDFLNENISICRKYNLDVVRGDIYNLSDINSGSIDAIIFMEVIEHLDYPDIAMGEIHRILKKSGKVIIVFPNDVVFKVARILTFRFKEAFYDVGHKRQWSPQEIQEFIKSHGFDIVVKKNIPFYFWCISLHGLIVGRKI